MSDRESGGRADGRSRSEVWKTQLKTLQDVRPPFVPEGASAMTIVVWRDPGDPGLPRTGTRGPPSGT